MQGTKLGRQPAAGQSAASRLVYTTWPFVVQGGRQLAAWPLVQYTGTGSEGSSAELTALRIMLGWSSWGPGPEAPGASPAQGAQGGSQASHKLVSRQPPGVESAGPARKPGRASAAHLAARPRRRLLLPVNLKLGRPRLLRGRQPAADVDGAVGLDGQGESICVGRAARKEW